MSPETGTIAGVASALAMALIGAVSSYISYQQKKFCFRIQRKWTCPAAACCCARSGFILPTPGLEQSLEGKEQKHEQVEIQVHLTAHPRATPEKASRVGAGGVALWKLLQTELKCKPARKRRWGWTQ